MSCQETDRNGRMRMRNEEKEDVVKRKSEDQPERRNGFCCKLYKSFRASIELVQSSRGQGVVLP